MWVCCFHSAVSSSAVSVALLPSLSSLRGSSYRNGRWLRVVPQLTEALVGFLSSLCCCAFKFTTSAMSDLLLIPPHVSFTLTIVVVISLSEFESSVYLPCHASV